jgi:hypothetical protein
MPQGRKETPASVQTSIIPYPSSAPNEPMFSGHRRPSGLAGKSPMTPEPLSRQFEEFLGGSRQAIVLEDGGRVFDLSDAKYCISGEYNKCLLHLWSAERNVVRRVVDAELRNGSLRLMVQRLGQTRPSKLEVCRGRDQRTPTARRTAPASHQLHLRRALQRHFPGFTVAKLSHAMDLLRSFGPIYTRGILPQGRTAFAVLGVNESLSSRRRAAALCGHLCQGTSATRLYVTPSTPPVRGAASPAVRDGKHCGRLPITPRVKRSGRRPREGACTGRSWGSSPAPPWPANLSGSS